MNRKKILLIFITIILGLGLFYIWFSRSDNQNVKREFLENNPTFEIVDLYAGDKNSDIATYHIKYTKPNNSRVYEHIAVYHRCNDNEWRLSCEAKNQ